jgi:hypothetical protein
MACVLNLQSLFVCMSRYNIYSLVRDHDFSSLISFHRILHFLFRAIRQRERAQILIIHVGLMQLTVFLLVNIEHRVE